VEMNPAAEAITGHTTTQALGLAADHVLWATRSDLAEHTRDMHEARVEVALGAEPRHYEAKISPIYDSHGHLSGRVVMLHDLTHRHEVEAELRTAKEDAERA